MAEIPKLYSDLALSILKASLGFFGTTPDPAVEQWLTACLSAADRELRVECGIQLTHGDVYDDNLQAMYALWIYSKRRSGEGKPQMLVRAIRNRQVCKALAEGTRKGGCP